MITINIDKTSPDTPEIAEYLRGVATLVEQGFTSGEDWELNGGKETLPEEPEEIDEFTGEIENIEAER